MEGSADAYYSLGTYYLQTNKYQRAAEYFTKALNTSNQIGSLVKKKAAAEKLSDTYVKLGNYKSALKFYRIYSGHCSMHNVRGNGRR